MHCQFCARRKNGRNGSCRAVETKPDAQIFSSFVFGVDDTDGSLRTGVSNQLFPQPVEHTDGVGGQLR